MRDMANVNCEVGTGLSSSCSTEHLLEAISRICRQKQRPTVERIFKAIRKQRKLNVTLDEIKKGLAAAVSVGHIQIVDSNGITSYREWHQYVKLPLKSESGDPQPQGSVNQSIIQLVNCSSLTSSSTSAINCRYYPKSEVTPQPVQVDRNIHEIVMHLNTTDECRKQSVCRQSSLESTRESVIKCADAVVRCSDAKEQLMVQTQLAGSSCNQLMVDQVHEVMETSSEVLDEVYPTLKHGLLDEANDIKIISSEYQAKKESVQCDNNHVTEMIEEKQSNKSQDIHQPETAAESSPERAVGGEQPQLSVIETEKQTVMSLADIVEINREEINLSSGSLSKAVVECVRKIGTKKKGATIDEIQKFILSNYRYSALKVSDMNRRIRMCCKKAVDSRQLCKSRHLYSLNSVTSNPGDYCNNQDEFRYPQLPRADDGVQNVRLKDFTTIDTGTNHTMPARTSVSMTFF